MNRTDRLYALVEELRAVAPRPRSASWLSRRFEVSVRTIERDLDALRGSGVPIWAEPGRTGGYALDRDRTLPPLALTPDEALAIAVALRSAEDSPFAGAARSAAQKVLATLPADVRRAEEQLAGRVHRVGPTPPAVPAAITEGVSLRRVLGLSYVDGAGRRTRRDVEPVGFLWAPAGWYLIGWCRLRTAPRAFLLRRIDDVELRAEVAPPRDVELRPELERIRASPLRN